MLCLLFPSIELSTFTLGLEGEQISTDFNHSKELEVSERVTRNVCVFSLWEGNFCLSCFYVHALTFQLQMMMWSVGNNVILIFIVSSICFSSRLIFILPFEFVNPVLFFHIISDGKELSVRSFLTHVFHVLILLLDSFSPFTFLSLFLLKTFSTFFLVWHSFFDHLCHPHSFIFFSHTYTKWKGWWSLFLESWWRWQAHICLLLTILFYLTFSLALN